MAFFGKLTNIKTLCLRNHKPNFPLATNSTSSKGVLHQKLWTHKHVEKCVASDSFDASVHMRTFFQDKFARISFCMSLFTKEIVNTDNVKECSFCQEHFPICNIPTHTPDRRSYHHTEHSNIALKTDAYSAPPSLCPSPHSSIWLRYFIPSST